MSGTWCVQNVVTMKYFLHSIECWINRKPVWIRRFLWIYWKLPQKSMYQIPCVIGFALWMTHMSLSATIYINYKGQIRQVFVDIDKSIFINRWIAKVEFTNSIANLYVPKKKKNKRLIKTAVASRMCSTQVLNTYFRIRR